MAAINEGNAYWRISGIYFFYFALLGAIIPYWNLYLAQQGYSALEIGYLGAILMGTKVVSPYLLGWLTDRTGKPVKVIRYSNFAALFCFLLIYLLPESSQSNARFWQLAFIVAGFSFFWNAVVGQYEALTFLYLGKQHHRYGSIRGWGSIGFIVAVSALGYWFEAVELKALPHAISLLLALIWVSSLFVKELPLTDNNNGYEQPSIIGFLRRKDVLGFLAGCFLVKVAHGPYYTFYSIYLDAWHYTESTIGWLWSVGVIAELAMFFVFSWLLHRLSLAKILMFSALSGVARWLIIGLLPSSIGGLLFAQLLHAITFASYHAAAVNWVREEFGQRHQGQGQALYSAVSFGAGSALGAILSGLIWTDQASINWTACWLLAAAVSLLAALVFRVSLRHQSRPVSAA